MHTQSNPFDLMNQMAVCVHSLFSFEISNTWCVCVCDQDESSSSYLRLSLNYLLNFAFHLINDNLLNLICMEMEIDINYVLFSSYTIFIHKNGLHTVHTKVCIDVYRCVTHWIINGNVRYQCKPLDKIKAAHNWFLFTACLHIYTLHCKLYRLQLIYIP